MATVGVQFIFAIILFLKKREIQKPCSGYSQLNLQMELDHQKVWIWTVFFWTWLFKN